ncbi:hypothetical protein PC9H_008961 [Pleurotus ostreatus]|uniref:Uncharacterized protein n=1 Tax=Pleurotus ostreatus TaxID=5322 RepID=A0A8H6ZS57_PLEOS|nr:uncharacterized protein PC9H_008961 [Pleurotus ostreatus]KAF7426592.1 hypothetical protein PC9H_008961 [Pleurotus ostreatus]
MRRSNCVIGSVCGKQTVETVIHEGRTQQAFAFTLNFATFFTTCIALNLQLVLVQRVNGKAMEKSYVIVVTLLSIVLTVPAFSPGVRSQPVRVRVEPLLSDPVSERDVNFTGWDEANFTCWVNTRRSSGLSVPTQSFWIALAATIETICSVTDMLCDRARLDGEVSYNPYAAVLKSRNQRVLRCQVRTRHFLVQLDESSTPLRSCPTPPDSPCPLDLTHFSHHIFHLRTSPTHVASAAPLHPPPCPTTSGLVEVDQRSLTVVIGPRFDGLAGWHMRTRTGVAPTF